MSAEDRAARARRIGYRRGPIEGPRLEQLNDLDRRILDLIPRHWAEHHYGPTERGIAASFKLPRNTVRFSIRRLKAAGLVGSPPKIGYALRLLTPNEREANMIARWTKLFLSCSREERRAACIAAEQVLASDRTNGPAYVPATTANGGA